MQHASTSPIDRAASPHGDLLARIAERRERFVILIRHLTGASAARAEQVFRPLPFVDSRRRGALDGDFGGRKAFANDLVRSAGLHLNFGGK